MLFQILGAPIGGPIAGMKFIFNQILEMAERELYDEDRIREDLLLLQLQLEEGEVSEARGLHSAFGDYDAPARRRAE